METIIFCGVKLNEECFVEGRDMIYVNMNKGGWVGELRLMWL